MCMKLINKKLCGATTLLILFFSLLTGCGPNSSPEGRMTLKLEQQQEVIDSLKQQNRAILDSLSRIRQDLQELKALQK